MVFDSFETVRRATVSKPFLLLFPSQNLQAHSSASTKQMAKSKEFYVDWWIIKTRTVYSLIFFIVSVVVLAGGGWYFYHYAKNSDFTPTKSVNAATFASIEGEVRVVRASTRESLSAVMSTQLAAGDAVQTQADGRARIQLADGSILVVRPNSTVVIRDNTSSLTGTNVRVALGSGQINVKTEDLKSDANSIVEVKQTESKLSSETDASFSINSATNNEEIRITRGKVETTNNAGEKTVVRSGEYVSFNSVSGRIERTEKLVDAPRLIDPASLRKFLADSNMKGAPIEFRWQKPASGNAATYDFEIATSPFFVPSSRISARENLAATEFFMANVGAGTYFWRVRAKTPNRQESEWSDAWKFVVTPPGSGEKVPVSNVVSEFLGGRIYLVGGHAKPATVIRIGDRETNTGADGTFRLQISAPSENVELQATDEGGNTTRYDLSLTKGKMNIKN